MSKNATPPKRTTTPAKQPAKTAKKAAPAPKASPSTSRKQSPVTASKRAQTKSIKASDDSYKTAANKPDGNPTVTRRLAHGNPTVSEPKNPTVTRGFRARKSAPAKEIPATASAPAAQEAPEKPPRPLFRRATVLLQASVEVPVHAGDPDAHKESHGAPQNAAQAHGAAPSLHTATGAPAGPPAAGAPVEHGGTPAAGEPEADPFEGLTDMQRRFAWEYVQDCNATRAYMRATRTTHVGTAGTNGTRLMKDARIRALIEVEQVKLQERTGVTAEKLLLHLWLIATADARELTEHIVECCRWCYGVDHLYQRTDIELARDRLEFENYGRQRINGVYVGERKAKKEAKDRGEPRRFEEQGGGGFDPTRAPHKGCPQCHGHGESRPIFHDTRLLSPQAALLYAGTRKTKEGLEILTQSQEKAREMIAKHIGFYDADNRQKKAEDPFAQLLARISGPGAALPINPHPTEEDEP